MARKLTRAAAGLVGATALVLGTAWSASAHVGVTPTVVDQGSFPRLSFTVPTEVKGANTSKVQIELPTEYTFEGVAKPTPGWHMKVEKKGAEIGEGMTRVTWTALTRYTQIKPDEYQEFELSLGPVPKAGKLYFDATQTYDTGQVVEWVEVPSEDNPNPRHPAPSVTVTASAEGDASRASYATGRSGPIGNEDGPAILSSPLQATGAAVVLLGAGGLTVRSVMRRRTGNSVGRA